MSQQGHEPLRMALEKPALDMGNQENREQYNSWKRGECAGGVGPDHQGLLHAQVTTWKLCSSLHISLA